MRPEAWSATCPTCGETHEVDRVEEDDAGMFFADENRFIVCQCGEQLDVMGAQVTDVGDEPFEQRRG